MKSCWLFPKRPPVFVLLGRFGDIIQLLPCFKAIHDRTGTKPIVISSHDYGNVFEGVSYVEARTIRAHWYMGVPTARDIADSEFGGGIVPQWWHDKERSELLEAATKGSLVLQCHGHNWGVDISKWPDYGTSMADRCGFSRKEWINLPLVFDKRDRMREATLCRSVMNGDSRPMLLYNFKGNSSPFGFVPEVLNRMISRFNKTYHMVDLGKVRAHRIYDLLGLYDRAAGLVTSDTSTLHLAPGSKIPYVAYTVGGWTQSVPKGNCKLQITYNHAPQRLNELCMIVDQWKDRQRANHPQLEQVHA